MEALRHLKVSTHLAGKLLRLHGANLRLLLQIWLRVLLVVFDRLKHRDRRRVQQGAPVKFDFLRERHLRLRRSRVPGRDAVVQLLHRLRRAHRDRHVRQSAVWLRVQMLCAFQEMRLVPLEEVRLGQLSPILGVKGRLR